MTVRRFCSRQTQVGRSPIPPFLQSLALSSTPHKNDEPGPAACGVIAWLKPASGLVEVHDGTRASVRRTNLVMTWNLRAGQPSKVAVNRDVIAHSLPPPVVLCTAQAHPATAYNHAGRVVSPEIAGSTARRSLLRTMQPTHGLSPI